MKTVGIIGGLGPETTSEFYLEVVFGCYEQNKVQRPPILLWSVPLKYDIEEDLILNNKGEERYIPYLIEAAKNLEAGGADFLVMPCNSLHLYINELRRAVSIPVLSIIEETSAFLKKEKIDTIGLLATEATVQNNLYGRDLSKNNIKQITPDAISQTEVNRVIGRLVMHRHDDADRDKVLKIIDGFLVVGVKTVILACTDLQLIDLKPSSSIKIFDSMKILAEACTREILS